MKAPIYRRAKIVHHGSDSEYTMDRKYVDEYMGAWGVIVDYSDSHGECYGIVFANFNGSSGRKEHLEVFWFEPDEIEII